MSFPIKCTNCGAISGPSVGVCPYCKTVMSGGRSKDLPTLKKLKQLYSEGRLPESLALVSELLEAKPNLLEKIEVSKLYVEILLDSEAPSSKVRSVLQKSLALHPESSELQDLLDIVNARFHLRHGEGDPGEQALRSVLRRSPQHPQACFILGSHLFYVEKNLAESLSLLEKVVRKKPNFLRGLACLAMVYRAMGADASAQSLLRKCVTLERDPAMKSFFQDLLKK
jgi:tetratricopeptide (TPR) repeat protein